MKKNKRRLHPLELAAKNASFDILGYIRKKYKEAPKNLQIFKELARISKNKEL